MPWRNGRFYDGDGKLTVPLVEDEPAQTVVTEPAQGGGSTGLGDYAARLNAAAGVRPAFSDDYAGKLESLRGQIDSRAPFRYDAGSDPLYRSYRDSYVQGGRLAMRDSVGRAAALTGGYGSSYAQAVGQQSYDQYLQKLGDVIPALYDRAYGRYQDEGDALQKRYEALGRERDEAYSRYRDRLGDWEKQRDWLRALESEDYDRRTAAESEDYKRRTAEEERAWQRQRDAETDSWKRRQDNYKNLYAAIKASGYRPTDAELEAAGMTRAEARAVAEEYRRAATIDEREIAVREWLADDRGTGSYPGVRLWWDDYDDAAGKRVNKRYEAFVGPGEPGFEEQEKKRK